MRYLLGLLATAVVFPAIGSQEDGPVADSILDSSTADAQSAIQEASQTRREFCRHDDLERDFDRKRDDEWADVAEAVLYSHIARVPSLSLTDFVVQCQVDVCRLRFSFPTAEYQREVGNTLVADAIDSAPGFLKNFGKIVPGVNGSPTIEYYLMRKGVCATRPVK